MKTTFGEMASSMGDILPIMSQLGLGMDIYSTSMAVLTKNGLQTSKATTGLKAAFSNIIRFLQKELQSFVYVLHQNLNQLLFCFLYLHGINHDLRSKLMNKAHFVL